MNLDWVKRCCFHKRKVGDILDYEMLNYILRDLNFNLLKYIQDVLDDDENSPNYSAVYTRNMIKCYIKLMNQIDNQIPFKDVKSYILYNDFSEQEYNKFEKSRKRESSYYKGKQF